MHKFYLLRQGNYVIERPQFLYMRVAVAMHGTNLDRVLESYELMSTGCYTPSTPVLYSAGTHSNLLTSSFLYQPPPGDTMSILGECIRGFERFWRTDGGLGLTLNAIPAQRYSCTLVDCILSLTYLSSSGTHPSSGPVPLLEVFNTHARVSSLNRFRRPSYMTVYLPIWHSDVMPFILSSTHRTSILTGLKHVHPALWIPDIL